MNAALRRSLLAAPIVLLPLTAAALLEEAPQRSERRIATDRAGATLLALPREQDAFAFAVFGDRTGGPPEGIEVLARAVAEVNLIEPDLVMTVGDLVQGYNDEPEWLVEMREFKATMDRLRCPWFPVPGNHDVHWRGPEGQRPAGENEGIYERYFGPLWYAFEHKRSWFVVLYSDEGDPRTGRKSFEEPAAQTMSPRQTAWLESILQRAKEAEHVFLFLHHPRWLKGGYGGDWDRVHALLARAGNVTAVFAGHIHHMRYDGRKDGIEYFSLATVGGEQSGEVPGAGYLHQYHLVTVRKGGIAVTCYPVESAMDPRRITGEVSDECLLVARELRPDFARPVAVGRDGAADGLVSFALRNPGRAPIEVEVAPRSEDSRWTFSRDALPVALSGGESKVLELRATHRGGGLDAAWRAPELRARIQYLAEGWRLPLPERSFEIPLDPAGLEEPAASAAALVLDGRGACARVEDASLALPDGPFTVEGWLCAEGFRERQGLINKTESSEFGLFASGGTPEFCVHVGGRYAVARAASRLLEEGRWHHVAGVFDGGEARLYVDGRLAASAPGSGARTPNDLPLLIGADVDGAGRAHDPLAGRVDEVRISKVARYSGPSFRPARRLESDADTVLMLHLDAASGPWLYDSSPARCHARSSAGARVN